MKTEKLKGSDPSRVRVRILTPMVVALLFLLGTFIFTIYKIQDRNASNVIAMKMDSAHQLFDVQLNNDAAMMSAVLKLFLSSEKMAAALSAKNRNRLLEYSRPLFEELHREHKITHLYFSGPDRVNILRVHRPEKFGDIINRFTTLEAERTKKLFYGLELGPMGTFTLRVVAPYYRGGRLLGYVELGEEIDHIVRKMSEVLSADVYIAIEKKVINQKEWESGMAILGRQTNWDRFPTAVIVSENQKSFPQELAYYIQEEQHIGGVTEVSLEVNGRHYRGRFRHLAEVSGREIGDMIIVYDVTDIISVAKHYTIAAGIIYLVVGGLLFFFFFAYLTGVERTLGTAREKLTEWNRTLEEQVEERTKEMKKSQKQVTQSSKMAAVGQLAGGVAHDFNNLLSVILGFTGFALKKLQDGDPLKDNLQEVAKAGERAAALIRQLLAFSRKQPLQPVVLDINIVLKNMEGMLKRLIPEDIEFRTIFAGGLGRVKADPGQIEQVIVNLVVNARDAMPKGGKLTMETSNVELGEEYARSHVGTTAGPHVLLTITDNGCGMDEETKNRVFEPFFTTKEKGKGTGMGLATVYGIVTQSGGNIWVYSEPGKGTTFKIYLPRVDGEVASPIKQDASPAPGSGELVLVVEDEPALRALFGKMLESLGYTMASAANSGEVLVAVEEQGMRPDLLITDVVLPGMSGKVLAERLHKTMPDLKVLYMSGYTDDAIVHHGILDSNTPFIQKPFDIKDLAIKIRGLRITKG